MRLVLLGLLLFSSDKAWSVSAAGVETSSKSRALCAAVGKYEPFQSGMESPALIQRFDGPSFFSYEGEWVLQGGDYHYSIRPPCELLPMKRELVSRVLEKLRHLRRSSVVVRVVMVGDSIMIRQSESMRQQLKAAVGDAFFKVEFFRSDKLDVRRSRDRAWLEAGCKADLLVLNTGAHFSRDQLEFKDRLGAAIHAINISSSSASGGKRPPLVLFRTTPEGNPLCNSRGGVLTARQWESEVWAVINGSKPVPPGDPYFSRGWHWDQFQHYNAIAQRIAARYDFLHVVDVVGMARIHPTPQNWIIDTTTTAADKKRGSNKKKPLDCLHSNPAVPTYNTLIFNVLDAILQDNHHQRR
jgi:hypothetical protein